MHRTCANTHYNTERLNKALKACKKAVDVWFSQEAVHWDNQRRVHYKQCTPFPELLSASPRQVKCQKPFTDCRYLQREVCTNFILLLLLQHSWFSIFKSSNSYDATLNWISKVIINQKFNPNFKHMPSVHYKILSWKHKRTAPISLSFY